MMVMSKITECVVVTFAYTRLRFVKADEKSNTTKRKQRLTLDSAVYLINLCKKCTVNFCYIFYFYFYFISSLLRPTIVKSLNIIFCVLFTLLQRCWQRWKREFSLSENWSIQSEFGKRKLVYFNLKNIHMRIFTSSICTLFL